MCKRYLALTGSTGAPSYSKYILAHDAIKRDQINRHLSNFARCSYIYITFDPTFKFDEGWQGGGVRGYSAFSIAHYIDIYR